ncbi:hypothetical protein LTR84_005496 [Exophiala bonariae]|uniref:Major facilitator superfamily (MFS) profile domain-containing protein n=1 Tax=Exophiala bonariae TaxID=1690606 RepID=A0AAV9N406_9EURO|nr:hypothetical protein LTR84_005496 [Exophiala bonariae]
MSAPILGAFITHASKPEVSVSGLSPVLHRDQVFTSQPTHHELDELKWGERLNGPKLTPEAHVSIDQSFSRPEEELESSQGVVSPHDRVVDAFIPSASNPPRNRWRLAAAGVMFLLMGLNDAATGALIPYLEKEYNISYGVVSLIFITNAIGFISVVPVCQLIEAKLGRARSYVVAACLMSTGYTALVCAPPFPVVVLSFYFLGSGMGLFLAMTNTFIVNLMRGTVILGAMHGLYGVGGVVSPMIATAIVTRGIRWSYFYFIPLSLAVSSILFMGWSYKGFEDDAASPLLTTLERTASRQAASGSEITRSHLLRRALNEKTTLLGAAFIFFYQGAEVAISGWVISYLITYRNGNPTEAGYIGSGFWLGITVGRFVLTHFAHKFGEKRAVIALTVGAAAFQLLVWQVPNIIGNAVAEALVGLFLGPVYPCATAIFSKLLPRNMQVTALSVVGGMGSSGGALVPFITGMLAQKLGTVVLHPIVLISFAAMLVTWFLLPRVEKRRE